MNALILYGYQLICPECGVSLNYCSDMIVHPSHASYASADKCSNKSKVFEIPTVELKEKKGNK